MNPLKVTGHRPWPLPEGPWIMSQTWHHLLFAHWRMDPAALRPMIPLGLELDTYRGEAWIGIVPFGMRSVRLRGLPPIPGLSSSLELNVRTYVTCGGWPGVLFFSLDAGHPLAVAGARKLLGLPYFRARMSLEQTEDGVRFSSARLRGRGAGAGFEGIYRPTGEAAPARAGTLEAWLTERYRLYNANRGGVTYIDIHHVPWPLQPAELKCRANTIAQPAGLPLPSGEPLLHYAEEQLVRIWPQRRMLTGDKPMRNAARTTPSGRE